MARPTPQEWIKKNPIRFDETAEQYEKRYYDDTEEGYIQQAAEGVGQFGRGAALGLAQTGTSMVGGIGKLTGSRGMRDWARETEQEAQEFYNPQGYAGAAGQIAGRVGGEIASTAFGVGAGAKLLSKAPAVAAALARGGRLGTAVKAAPFVGMDVLQGAAQDDGLVLRGTPGAIAENLLFSGAGVGISAVLKARAARKAEEAASSAKAFEEATKGAATPPPITDPSRLLPAAATAAGENVPMIYRPQFPAQPRGTPAVADLSGPGVAIPMPGPRRGPAAEPNLQGMGGAPQMGPLERTASPLAERGGPAVGWPEGSGARYAGRTPDQFAVVPYRQQPALPVSGRGAEMSQEVSDQVMQLRQQLDSMSPGERAAWMATNMPGTTERELKEIFASALPAGPLARREAESLRGLKAPKMRARRGAASPELLSMLTGGTGGALYGGATAEEGESPLARALAYGAGGAAGGAMAPRLIAGQMPRAPRFFESRATARAQETAQEAKGIRADEIDALRDIRNRPTTPPKIDDSAIVFPENRRPLLERTDLSPVERTLLESKITKTEPVIKQPMTRKQYYEKVAKQIGETDINKLAAIDPRKATPEEAGALLAVHTDIRRQITQKLELAKRTSNLDEFNRLAKQVEDYNNIADNLLAKIMQGDQAAGQALNSRKYMAKEIADPTYWYLKGTRALKGTFLSLEQKAVIDKLAAEGSTEKLLQYMASIQKSSIPEQIAFLRSANLLAALGGRARDFISTSANYATTLLQRFPGVGPDIILAKMAARKLGGQAHEYRTMLAPTTQELTAALGGTKKGLAGAIESTGFNALKQGGFKAWSDYVRQAELDPDMVRRLELQYMTNIDMFSRMFGKSGAKADAVLDTYAKLVGRTSSFTDKVIRGAAADGALVEQLGLEATRRGLKGTQVTQYVENLLKNPDLIDDELKANAGLAADYITFMNNGRIAETLSGWVELAAKQLGNKSEDTKALVRAGARILVPFRRTPANILSRMIESTPGPGTVMALKAANDWHKALLNASANSAKLTPELAMRQRRMVELGMRQVTGLGLMALGAQYYQNGLMTGELPQSEAEREQWRTEGKKPESLLVGGEWLPIARISPFGNMMTLGASIVQSAEAKGLGTGIGTALAGAATSPLQTTQTLGRSLLNQPMVTGPQEALEAFTSRNEQDIESYGGSLAGSFIPTVVAQAARAEGVQRVPQTIGQSLTSRIPGMQETAPVRLNIFGEPVKTGRGVLNAIVNPLVGSPDIRKTDPLVAELAKVKAVVGPVARGKGESYEMYQYRQREAGKFVKEDLTALFQSAEYIEADVGEKRALIEDTVEKARRDLSKYLKETYGIGAQGKQ